MSNENENPKPSAEQCPDCGRVHEKGPSSAVIELYDRFKASTDEDEKTEVLLALAHATVVETSDSDIRSPEGLHDLIRELTEAQTKWHSLALRLGRLIVRDLMRSEADKESFDHLRAVVAKGGGMVFTREGPEDPSPEDGKKNVN